MFQRLIEQWRYFWIKRKFNKALNSIDVTEMDTRYLSILKEHLSKMFSKTHYKNLEVNARSMIVGIYGETVRVKRFLQLEFTAHVGCCSRAEYRLQNSAGYWRLYVKQTHKDGTVQAEFEKDALIYLGLAKLK